MLELLNGDGGCMQVGGEEERSTHSGNTAYGLTNVGFLIQIHICSKNSRIGVFFHKQGHYR